MAVYVVNDYYVIPKRYEGVSMPMTLDEFAEQFCYSDDTIYFWHDSDDVWLEPDHDVEKKDFVDWAMRGFDDVLLMDAGYDDLRINLGYEEGVILGFHEADTMGSVRVRQIAALLYDANKKDLDEVKQVVTSFMDSIDTGAN